MKLVRSIKNMDGEASADVAGYDSAFGLPRIPFNASISTYLETTGYNPLAIPAFHNGVRALSEDIASLPLLVYRKRSDGGRERAEANPWYETLHDFANPETTAFQWRETGVSHLNTVGNFFSEIAYDRAGRPQLWIIRPDRVDVHWDSQGRKAYDYLDPRSGRRPLDPAKVFHVAGLGYDGLIGYSPVTMFRESLMEGREAIEMARRNWAQGAIPGAVVTLPKEMPEPVKANFRAAWKRHEGSRHVGESILLEDGITANWPQIKLADAEFLATRKYHSTVVAQILRIPPDKIGDLEHATFSNIDQQDINYAKYSILPWCHRIEAEVKRQLLRDDPGLYAEFLIDGLLRGDPLTRASVRQIELRNGALTPNQWLLGENRDPLPPEIGDIPYFAADLVTKKPEATTDAAALIEQVKGGLLTIDEARAQMQLPPMQWAETPDTDELVKQLTAGLVTHDEARVFMGLPPLQWSEGPTHDEISSLLEQLKAGVLTHDEVREMLKRPPIQWPDDFGPDEVTSLIEQTKAGLLTENEARELMKREPLEYADGPSPDEITSLVSQIHEGLLTIDEARAQLGREPVAWPEDLSEKVTQAGDLIKAGFDPVDVMRTLGLPQIRHLGLPPVTVQKIADAEGGPGAPAAPDTAPMGAPQ